ncbi:hypothetical protein TVAG_161160 [Trichomonas vaginalis G3]|uniref:Uncharacterized protein n=1 Tax=Trichomonas vaginalis (strain ATCC PRA-98 / G3) TaxID=412133 RepID=A2E4X1_TRIV3|nr:hypothetical protein TVAGG3_0228410 [Trichomonas vaginalis G3]EAY12310.1 hypothetical protein TVAG_161160 [Trichomonas vaginalis G3]KAI5552438.1 hypothetical protein TVAGG3_0228410 [Trichomonas vaginalis G3]|eukprot:XP_001324533.1 hypothetical protein [Trichomonas vaginalis G3]
MNTVDKYYVNEKALEEAVKENMKRTGFKPKDCDAYKWLKSFFGDKFSSDDVKNLSLVINDKLGIQFGREYYRRKKTCIYWIQLNFQEIKEKWPNFAIATTHKDINGSDKVVIIPHP